MSTMCNETDTCYDLHSATETILVPERCSTMGKAAGHSMAYSQDFWPAKLTVCERFVMKERLHSLANPIPNSDWATVREERAD